MGVGKHSWEALRDVSPWDRNDLTCIPVSRDAPRDETNHPYFEFN
jgi:hypothetical protein